MVRYDRAMESHVLVHEPGTTARVVVTIQSSPLALYVVRRVHVCAWKHPRDPLNPPVILLDSARHTIPGLELELAPGGVLELAGDVPVLAATLEAFEGPVDWSMRLEPHVEGMRITAITINGHALPLP